MPVTVLLLAALLAPPKPTRTPTPVPTAQLERMLTGGWDCVSACPDDSIAFAIEGGRRTYRSWLRDRPATVGATWALEGPRLTVRHGNDVLYDWEIVRLTRVRLELKQAGQDAPIVMRRAR
jgi:hypothetical protein